MPLLFEKTQGYMKELGIDIRKVSGPQRGKYASGMLATTSGVDLKGKTSSAVARRLASGGVVKFFSAISGAFSSVVNPFSDS